ncbi:MAG TPA: GNAT family protein [Caulobacteraceae bacterium]|nr:GNAT family protein [Caulobacteraceae bacterium]
MAAPFTRLQTPRLDLRPLEGADGPAMHRYLSDAEVTRWLPEGVLDEAGVQVFIRAHKRPSAMAVAVVERETGQLVGHMNFHRWFQPATHEVGWTIAPDRQGRGYATEAAAALIAFAFGPLACHRVIATCQPQNTASWRVMEKLGMRREAHFRQALHRGGGVWWDEYFYALLAEEYASSGQG